MMSEVPGLKMARHGRGTLADPDTVSREATQADRDEVLAIARRYLPSAVGPTLSSRICLYTNSPDGHFIVDRHPGCERAVIACGFSGHGFKFASVMGEVLADLATTGATPLPIGFLGLERFGKAGS
jgi:glycine/D-amino acid oxidase-like deaminating enzyme